MAGKKCNAQGFTVIETLFALVLLLVFLSGAGELSAVALRAASGARDRTMAALLAVQKMEALRGAAAAGALALSPLTALDRDEAGCADRLDEAGQPLTPSSGVQGARYLRRWLVQPIAGGPPQARLVSVLVAPAVAGAAGSSIAAHDPRAVVLTSIVEG